MKLSELKIKKIRKTFGEGENPVEIYNITEDNKQLVNELLLEGLKNHDKIKIDGATIVLKLLPILTNITLDYDVNIPEERAILDDIIANPSKLLEDVVDEINEILQEQLQRINKTIDRFSNLSKETIEQLIGNVQPIATEEDKLKEEKERKKAELLKQLEELGE